MEHLANSPSTARDDRSKSWRTAEQTDTTSPQHTFHIHLPPLQSGSQSDASSPVLEHCVTISWTPKPVASGTIVHNGKVNRRPEGASALGKRGIVESRIFARRMCVAEWIQTVVHAEWGSVRDGIECFDQWGKNPYRPVEVHVRAPPST